MLSLHDIWHSKETGSFTAGWKELISRWWQTQVPVSLIGRQAEPFGSHYWSCPLCQFSRAVKNINTNWKGLKTTESYSLMVLQSRSLKSKCGQGHAPSEVYRGESFPASTNFWCFCLHAASLWSLNDHFHMAFSSMCLLFCLGTHAVGFISYWDS